MMDIVERAESLLSHMPYAPLPRRVSEKLLAELKATRAEYERLKTIIGHIIAAELAEKTE
jgi:hypothetical protein